MNKEQNELINSLVKTASALFPGISVAQEFFEFRNRIKQNRINDFIELLQQYLTETNLNQKFEYDLLHSEDFTDLFESVIKRVALTKSLDKLHRFKLILTNQLISNKDIAFSETYLDLVNQLREKQILILSSFRDLKAKLESQNLVTLNNTIQQQVSEENRKRSAGENNNYDLVKKELREFREFMNPLNFGITKTEYDFYVQDLVSKSLLIDIGIGAIDTKPYELMEITSFGNLFINFIEGTKM